MPISDWSSNVCSSDLILIDGVQLRDDVFPMNDYGHGLIGSVFPVRREARDVPRRILKILGRRFGLFVIPTRAGVTMNDKPSKLFQHMLGGRDLTIEIGEASCGERGCQDVKILVFAG